MRVSMSLLALVLALPSTAEAIPAFARRYKVSCQLCHNPVPKLTAFGEQFAANGFRFGPNEVPADTLATGDPLLTLLEEVPIAFRLDAYVQEFTGGKAVTDFQTPYALKLLSGAPISRKLSSSPSTGSSRRLSPTWSSTRLPLVAGPRWTSRRAG